MVRRSGASFLSATLPALLHGTTPYWFKQHSLLIAMVDMLGIPTIFFTHSSADTQWPELAKLVCDDPTDSSKRHQTVVDHPAVADWFFHQRIHHFIDHFYVNILST